MDFFWAAPPVTRTLAAAVFVESILAAVGILSPYSLIYDSRLVIKFVPQLWRLVSSFLLTFQLGIIMDPFFIWQYGVPLERSSTRFNSASFFVYLVFVGLMTIMLAGQILGSVVLLGPLSLAITYTFAQENRGQQMQFFVVSLDVKWLPYARLLLTLVLNGPESALSDATGIVAAHFYDFLTLYWPNYGGGTSLIRTPAIMNRWFGIDGSRRVEHKDHGTSYRPARPEPQTTNASSQSGTWGARGPGRRLGGD